MSLAAQIGKILDTEGVDKDDYFKVLGCSETSTPEQIGVEYKIRALKCHPDKNPGNDGALKEFQKLQEARDILTDPEMRKVYDKWRMSEMCIPFKTWLNMHNRCTTTMHWAKPKSQTMLQSGSEIKQNGRRSQIQEFYDDKNKPDLSEYADIRSGSKDGWEPDESSSVYNEFRNYKI